MLMIQNYVDISGWQDRLNSLPKWCLWVDDVHQVEALLKQEKNLCDRNSVSEKEDSYLVPFNILATYSNLLILLEPRTCQNSCNGCFVQLHKCRNIRQYLSDGCAILISNALVSIRLDYCNCKYAKTAGFSEYPLTTVTRHNFYSRTTTSLLKKLHWPPVQFHSIVKTVYCYNFKFLDHGFVHLVWRRSTQTVLD